MRTDIDRTLKILLTIILAAVVGYFAWQVVQRVLYPLTLFVMAAIVAFILSPLVDRLSQQGFPRPLAILVVYIGMLGTVSLLGYWLISPLLTQIQTLTAELPQRANELQPKLHNLDTFLKQYNLPTTDKLKTQASNYASSLGQQVFLNLSTLVLTSFNFLVNTVLVLVIAFYLLLDGEQLKKRLYSLVPVSQLSRVTFLEVTVNEVLGGYLRGQLLMALTIGTLAGMGTALLGVGYPAVVGVLAGILELVPMLGPWLASMPAVAIALFSPHPFPLTLWVALYFVVIQQLESNVIGPRITGHAVGLHPLAALMALLVGIELDGILGALSAVPVAGILYVIGMAAYYNFTGRERPEPQRDVTTSSLLGSLSNRMAWRASHSEQEDAARLRFLTMRLRRNTTGGPVPRRLADVEQKRDALLRDKLQQRQVIEEQTDALAQAASEAGEPLPAGQIGASAEKRAEEERARVS